MFSGVNDMGNNEAKYEQALLGKKVPVLTLDNKWHRLFTQADSNSNIQVYEAELNELIKRQGKLTTESKEIKAIKAKLMEEIVSLMDESDGASINKSTDKKLEENKRLINDCNDKLEANHDELLDLPKQIQEVNHKLMLATMDVCYEKIKSNTQEIEEIAEWITSIRIELKKKVIRKQEKERLTQDLYTYMHDIFGAEVIEIFDMKYNPTQVTSNKEQEKK